jgi:hypothetical protein
MIRRQVNTQTRTSCVVAVVRLLLAPEAPQVRSVADDAAAVDEAAGWREKRQMRQRGRPRAAARSQPTHTGSRLVIVAIRLRCAQCEQRGVGSGAQRRQTDGPW